MPTDGVPDVPGDSARPEGKLVGLKPIEVDSVPLMLTPARAPLAAAPAGGEAREAEGGAPADGGEGPAAGGGGRVAGMQQVEPARA